MNIAIVDDSREDRLRIAKLLERYAAEHSVILNISSYASGEEFFYRDPVCESDILFLDIYMDRMTGMDIAAMIKAAHSPCKIVFTSSSDAFALKSYEVRAFDYILKPVSYERLCGAMDLFSSCVRSASRFIVVKEGRELKKILISDILYADYHNHYMQLHTKSCVVSTYEKFSDFEARISGCPSFLTCYRCLTVNMDHIERINENFFLLKNGEYVPINRRRSKEIKAQYVSYVFAEMEGENYGR